MAIPFQILVAAAVLELLFLFLRSVPNHNRGVVQAVLLQFLTHTVYLVSVYLILKRPVVSLRWILGCAVIFRLTLWTAYPMLSDDIYRYRWEGKLQSSGGNPYQIRPSEDRANRDATFPNVGSKDFKAGYGPLIELEQRAVYETVSRFTPDPFVQVFWYKLPSALCELLTALTIVLLLQRRGLPESRILIYAWCPTPIVEFWWNGHNDALPILLISLALLCATAKRWVPGFALLSAAVAAKIWPILLFPPFILNGNRERPRWWQWTVVIPILLVFSIPFWSDVSENVRFMTGFVGGWRNNDSLFGGLLWLARFDLYRAKYMAETVIGLVSFSAALLPWSLESACLATLAGALLLSANSHPWYLTWLAPFVPFAPWIPVLLWMALEPLGYSVLIGWRNLGEWKGDPPLRWLVYCPTFVYAGVQWYLRLRRALRKTSVTDDK